MGLLGLPGKRVDAFAGELAREFAEACPPAEIGKKSQTPKRISAAARTLCDKAVKFRNEHKLGVYSKARLGNAVRWRLADLGYPTDLVEEITRQLVFRISQKSQK